MSNAPNIIYIMADDMGYGDLGCYGAEKIPTPNVDAVAAAGMRFTDAHASSAVCTPSRYSVLTGRYCWRTRHKRGVIWTFAPPLIDPARPTVASLLQAAGYATAAVGKWHVGLDWQAKDGHVINPEARADEGDVDYTRPFLGGPTQLGFDHFFGIAGSLDMPPYCFLENDRVAELPTAEKAPYNPQQKAGFMSPGWRDEDVDVRHAERAVAWLENHVAARPDQPFFLYLTPSAPHRPCMPPEFARGASRAGPRGDMVCVMDWVVGQITHALERLGKTNDTLLLITSDNGAQPFDVDRTTYGHLSCGELRGYKTHIWEGGHRVPLIARWPGHVPAGTTCEQTVGLIDLLGTCCELTGGDLPAAGAEDTVSLAPHLLGRTNEPSRRCIVHHSSRGLFALRQDRWKAVFGHGGGGNANLPARDQNDDLPGQLYDMADDWRETTNCWAEKPELIAEMAARLDRHREAGRSREDCTAR